MLLGRLEQQMAVCLELMHILHLILIALGIHDFHLLDRFRLSYYLLEALFEGALMIYCWVDL